MAEENELANLKSELRNQQEAEAREAAGARTLEGKQVEIHTVGPRAPASMLLRARAARVPTTTIAESDPTDPVVSFDTGPNDPVVIYYP